MALALPLYTQIASLTATALQTVFTLPVAPTNPTQSLLIVENLVFEYGVDFTISGTTLTWSGVGLSVGDRLHLLFEGSSSTATYDARQVFSAVTVGQTAFGLTEAPANPTEAILVVGLLAYMAADGVFSISGSVLTWNGPELDAGARLLLVYRQ